MTITDKSLARALYVALVERIASYHGQLKMMELHTEVMNRDEYNCICGMLDKLEPFRDQLAVELNT